MNKRALRLKQKRRMEREALKSEKINKLWDEMSNYNKEFGLVPLRKTKEQMLKFYNAVKEVDKRSVNKTGVISLVCSLVVLYKYYNFNKDNMLNYVKNLHDFILFIGESKRPLLTLVEEIEKDYKVCIMKRCENLPRLHMNEYNKYNMEDTIIKSTVDNFPYFIAMNAHVFMNYLSFNFNKNWNSDDLELFISNVFSYYKNVLADTLFLKTLNDILMSERKICVNLTTGTVNEIIKQ